MEMLTGHMHPTGPISGTIAMWVGRWTAVSPKEGVPLSRHLAGQL